MVDVIGLANDLTTRTVSRLQTCMQTNQVLDRLGNVVDRKSALLQRQVKTKLLVHLVATDLGKVVALGIEVEVIEQVASVLHRRRFARAQLAVDVQQRVFLRSDVVLLERGHEGFVLAKALADLLGGPAKSLEKNRDRLLALAVDAHGNKILLVDLELQPCTAAGNDLCDVDVLIGGLVDAALKIDAGRTHELGHHDALGAVDDERALVGHQRELAHEHCLGLDLACLVVHELSCDEQRSRVGEVLLAALIDRVLGGLEPVVAERQRHRAGEVLDGADLFEDLRQTRGLRDLGVAGCDLRGNARAPLRATEQPVKAGGLKGQKIGNRQRLANLGEGDAGQTRREGGDVGASQEKFLPRCAACVCHINVSPKLSSPVREHGGPRSGLRIVWAAQSSSIPPGHTAVYLAGTLRSPCRHRTVPTGVVGAVPRRQACEEVQEDGDSPTPKRQAPMAFLGKSVIKT